AGDDGDVLLAVDGVGHRAVDDLAAQAGLPELCAGMRVERVEVPLAPSGEEQVARGGQDAAVGHVELLEGPLLLARLRIDGHHRSVAGGVGPVVDGRGAADADAGRARDRRERDGTTTGKVAARYVLRRFLSEDRRIALPRRDVHEPRSR